MNRARPGRRRAGGSTERSGEGFWYAYAPPKRLESAYLGCKFAGLRAPWQAPRSHRPARKTSWQVFPSTNGRDGADTRIRTEDLLFTKQLLYR
jgi:hypothetical protein